MNRSNLNPLFQTMTVGFEDMVKRVQDIQNSTQKTLPVFPPYNIKKIDENKYSIEIALAGFTKNEIEVELKDNQLTISGKVNSDEPENFLYKGIANRAFKRSFELADTIEIQETKLLNGMLKIFLENIIPEHKKPQKIEIEE